MQIDLSTEEIDTILWAIGRAYGNGVSRWDDRVLKLKPLEEKLKHKPAESYDV